MDASGVIVGVICGSGGASGIWKLYIDYRLRSQKKKILSGLLNDERWEWRTLQALQKAIGEDSATATKELLIEIGARASTGKNEVWTLVKQAMKRN